MLSAEIPQDFCMPCCWTSLVLRFLCICITYYSVLCYCCMIYLFDFVAPKRLVSDLTPAAYLWFVIGTHLKIPPGILRNIKTADGEAFQCLLRMVQQWLEDGKATKAELVKAVKSPAVRNQRLSDQIAGSYHNIIYIARPTASYRYLYSCSQQPTLDLKSISCIYNGPISISRFKTSRQIRN